MMEDVILTTAAVPTQEILTTVVQTQEIQTTVIQIQETSLTCVSDSCSSDFYNFSFSDLHRLYYSFGVDLDYVPSSPYEAFTMGLQFLAAFLFLYYFFKFLFTLIRGIGR
jgi:hypothetical protein